jgi:hypothetical protein
MSGYSRLRPDPRPRSRPDDTHFMDEANEGTTLCGQPWTTIVWSNDPRARCEACIEAHNKRTGWSFPLPETVA